MRGVNVSTRPFFYRSRSGTFFGVLKGISNYFAINVFWLRIGTIIGMFLTGFFPVLFIYFSMAMIMKKEPLDSFQKYTVQEAYQGRLYRSRNGLLLGLLRGIADRFDLSIFWLRFFIIVASFFTGFIPLIVIYLITSLFISKDPIVPINSSEEEEFYNAYTHSREGAILRVKQRFDKIEARIQRLESCVTDREFAWGHKMESNHT